MLDERVRGKGEDEMKRTPRTADLCNIPTASRIARERRWAAPARAALWGIGRARFIAEREAACGCGVALENLRDEVRWERRSGREASEGKDGELHGDC